MKVLSAWINQVCCMWFIYKVGPTTWYITTVCKRERANEWMAVMYPCYKKCNPIIPACNIYPFEDANSWNSIRFNRLFLFFCESEGLQLLKGWRQIPSYQQCFVTEPWSTWSSALKHLNPTCPFCHHHHPQSSMCGTQPKLGVHGPAQSEKHKLIWASNMSVQARTFSQSAGQARPCFSTLAWAFYHSFGLSNAYSGIG